MEYSVKKYFNKEECNNIVAYCLENGVPFKYNPADNWDCRRISDNNYKESILNKFSNHQIDIDKSTISLTTYKNGSYLELHKDAISTSTTVIVLNEGFNDGKFVLSETAGSVNSNYKNKLSKFKIGAGEGITFNGSKVWHGVMPVVDGVRYALNIWIYTKNHII